MKLLLAVFSCHRYVYYDADLGLADWLANKRITEDRVPALRATWLRDAATFGFDYKIFKGRGATRPPLLDEVFLDCDDSYFHASDKMLAITQWAAARGYDYVFKVDDDSFVYLDRLRASGFEKHDYIGRHDLRISGYLPGGPGYWLSAKAVRALAGYSRPQPWQEDVWVGRTLSRLGYELVSDPRYVFGGENIYMTPEQCRDCIAATACSSDTMNTLYQQIHSGEK